GWPDLDEALGRQFAMPRFLPPAPVEAQHDLPFDVGPGRVQDGGIVEAVLWTVSEGSAPILVHRHRIAGEAVARAWTFYLPEDDAPQSRMHPRGLWGAPDAEGYRFDLLVHRKRSGALLLGAAGEDGLLHRLWIVPAEDGVVRSGWIRGPGGRWTEESVEGRHLLDERVWTERQRSA